MFDSFSLKIFGLFTNNEEVIQQASNGLDLFLVYILLDNTLNILGAYLRGISKISFMCLCCIINYIILYPLFSYTFGKYFGLKIEGIWIGIIFACLAMIGVYIYYIAKVIDYSKIQEESKAKLDSNIMEDTEDENN